ncbi:rod shape-determining protein MreC [Marinoscillum sp.]|uniref:rod shape-determining protein MreC n=1 Tax=Marinoscillum sp. TaxID=2024838 RepID=UPI003BAD4947
MQNLLNFLYRFRTFGLFLLLEGVCAWLIIAYNQRPNAAFLNSSNSLVAGVNLLTSNTTNYFQLKQINSQLVAENQLLREQLANHSLGKVELDTSKERYILKKARVINSTFRRSMNYMTLDAGLDQGIKPGMGVISGFGVVGQVKSASNSFATVTSLLHRNLLISSSISRTNTLCTVQWDGESPLQAELKYVPRHIPIKEGDSIVTSGYNAIFPKDIYIGKIASFELEDNDVFYNAKIDLAVDFSSVDYVFVIENRMKQEQDSLELEAITE